LGTFSKRITIFYALYTDSAGGSTAAITRYVSFAQITCLFHCWLTPTAVSTIGRTVCQQMGRFMKGRLL